MSNRQSLSLSGKIGGLFSGNARQLKELSRANDALMLAYDATLEVWARALEKRKHETEGHVRRVTEMTVEMAGLMHMTDEQIMHVRRAARPYRNAWTDEETWDYIDRQTGLEFDPEVVKLFTETHKKH